MERNYSVNSEWSTDKDAPKAIFLSDPVVADALGIEVDNWDSADEKTTQLIKSKYKYNASLTWEGIEKLREVVDIPIVLKGVLHPEDAKMALDIGVEGIVVSSHGGRRIDGAIGAVGALGKISEIVGGEIPVLFDSGVRTGADVFKALALGATAVQIGRPYAYGLTLAGEQGVYEIIGNLLAELESTIGVAGYKNLKEVRESNALVHYP
jgi:isopentenyl diphosphate isomerase/L-lactate dehydrogenase-like FMN-dependent dehydrogenase